MKNILTFIKLTYYSIFFFCLNYLCVQMLLFPHNKCIKYQNPASSVLSDAHHYSCNLP